MKLCVLSHLEPGLTIYSRQLPVQSRFPGPTYSRIYSSFDEGQVPPVRAAGHSVTAAIEIRVQLPLYFTSSLTYILLPVTSNLPLYY